MNLDYVDFNKLEELTNEGFSEELTRALKQVIIQGDKDVRRIIATYNNLPKEIKELLYSINDPIITVILKTNEESKTKEENTEKDCT